MNVTLLLLQFIYVLHYTSLPYFPCYILFTIPAFTQNHSDFLFVSMRNIRHLKCKTSLKNIPCYLHSCYLFHTQYAVTYGEKILDTKYSTYIKSNICL